MTEHQRLFFVQASSDFRVFELLTKTSGLPACHALHYLQMATEKLGKTYAWKNGRQKRTHRAFVSFLRSLSTNRKAQMQLVYERQNERWKHLLRESIPLAERIEDLSPDLAGDGPNPEYPWPPSLPEQAPAEFAFDLWEELQGTAAGRQFVKLQRSLFLVAEEFL